MLWLCAIQPKAACDRQWGQPATKSPPKVLIRPPGCAGPQLVADLRDCQIAFCEGGAHPQAMGFELFGKQHGSG
jgi:hypothetical protein